MLSFLDKQSKLNMNFSLMLIAREFCHIFTMDLENTVIDIYYYVSAVLVKL